MTAIWLLSPTSALAAIVTVPDDHATLQLAVSAASPGDTVFLRASTYNENVTIGKSLTLKGEDRQTTIVDGGGSTVLTLTASYITICDVTITNGLDGIYMYNYSLHHITVRDAIITGNSAYGIHLRHSSGKHVIENCIISHNTVGTFGHQFSNCLIRDCDVFSNATNGIVFGWGLYTLVTDNEVHDNGNTGIAVDSDTYCTVENNKVYNNGRGMYVGFAASRNTIRDNLVMNNVRGIIVALKGGAARTTFITTT